MEPGPDALREQQLRQQGYPVVAGVDEAGRGPLAGPVVAAAAVLPESLEHHALAGVRDSKQLNESQREQFYQTIIEHAQSYAIAKASPQEIDLINIRQASLLAMRRAVEQLDTPANYALIDGRDVPEGLPCPGEAMVKGDRRSISIGAASILAKVVRDRIMDALHLEFPMYGWKYHKGYPTPYHRLAVQLFGPSRHHRTCFRGVSEWMNPITPSEQLRAWFDRIETAEEIESLKAIRQKVETDTLSPEERTFLLRSIEYHIRERKALIHTNTTTDRGKTGETHAAAWLRKKGYTIWETNFRIAGGEIDLIANLGSLIVFIEVKARSSNRFGTPEEALTATKRSRIIRTAERYLADRALNDVWDIRYDLIAIESRDKEAPDIRHIPDVFRVEEDFA